MEKSTTKNQTTFDNDEILTLFQLNCWLIPALLPNAQANRCINQEERAHQISKLVLKHDVSALQEVWGAALEQLNTPILKKDTHFIVEDNQTWTNYGGFFGDILNTSLGWASGLGGLWFSNRKGLSSSKRNHSEPLHTDKHSYSNSQTWSGKGCRCMLLDVSSIWRRNGKLLVFTTHLDKHNKKGMQSAQLEELRQFMHEQIELIYKNFYMKSSSRMAEELSVILTGDFNIPDDHEDYNKLLMSFIHKDAMRDLYKEYGQEHDIKLKYTYIKHKQRLDFVFGVDEFSGPLSNYKRSFRPLYAHKVDVLQQLKISDHYPTTMSLLRRK